MNFKSILEMQDNRDALQNKRRQQAQAEYQQAWELAQNYLKQPAVTTLIQALEHLHKTLSYQANHTDSYYLMAYIFYLLGMLPESLKYLKICLYNDEKHIQALKLRTILSSGAFEPLDVAQDQQSVNAALDLDHEQVYQDLENRIRQQMDHALRMELPFHPDFETSTLEKLQQIKHCMEQEQHFLQTQLQILEATQDITQLLYLLIPFEKRLAQVRQVYLLSLQQQKTYQEIQQLMIHIQESVLTETQLENIMTQCDRIADRLDEMEAKKTPIDTLIKHYNRLIHVIEALQDHLDDQM